GPGHGADGRRADRARGGAALPDRGLAVAPAAPRPPARRRACGGGGRGGSRATDRERARAPWGVGRLHGLEPLRQSRRGPRVRLDPSLRTARLAPPGDHDDACQLAPPALLEGGDARSFRWDSLAPLRRG